MCVNFLCIIPIGEGTKVLDSSTPRKRRVTVPLISGKKKSSKVRKSKSQDYSGWLSYYSDLEKVSHCDEC